MSVNKFSLKNVSSRQQITLNIFICNWIMTIGLFFVAFFRRSFVPRFATREGSRFSPSVIFLKTSHVVKIACFPPF